MATLIVSVICLFLFCPLSVLYLAVSTSASDKLETFVYEIRWLVR